mgnify:CR=1 FL=1
MQAPNENLSVLEKEEMELWYTETRDRYWAEEAIEWTTESYAMACIAAHQSDRMGHSA